MRLKQLENQWRCYLNPTDYRRIRACAESRRAHIAIRLGGECGLRVSETAVAKPGDIRDSTSGVDARFLGVFGKDTSGKREDGKFRDVFLPDSLYREICIHAAEEGIDVDNELIPVTKRTTQEYIKRAAKTAARRYDVETYGRVSSHDLRAFFATHHLIRLGMKAEVVQAVGGWKDYKSMEPYLNAQFDDVITESFNDAGIV